jgi:hypothetical protein
LGNRSRSLVWCSIEYQWRNECGAINFICTLFYFVGAFGGIAELYAQIQKRLSYRACFELLEETPEKINSEKNTSPLEKMEMLL